MTATVVLLKNAGVLAFHPAEKLKSKTLAPSVRADLQSLSFGLFMQRLRGFIKSHRMDIMLLEVEEHETSQVCGSPECEAVVKIGGAEVYHCQNCEQSYHRDCMAARNIFLKVGPFCGLKSALPQHYLLFTVTRPAGAARSQLCAVPLRGPRWWRCVCGIRGVCGACDSR